MRKIILSLAVFLSALLGMQAQTVSENFDSYANGSIPTGWTSYTTQTDDPGFMVVTDTGIARSPYNILAHKGVDINQESTSWIVSPAINVPANQELVFYWREKWSYAYNYSGVYISTASNDPINNPNDFTELGEFDPDDYPDTWNLWNKAMFDLSSYANQTVYIAFKYVGDFAHDFYVDDFQISSIPYCNPTTDINIDDYTDTTLDVSWDPVPNEDTYEIVWGPAGFDPNTGTPETVTGTSYTITGLSPSTWYDIYIRTMCSSYNYSSWSGPEAGRTSGPPPVNDTCAGAIDLTVYPALGGSVGHETVGDTWDATPSAMSQTSCDSYGTNLDLFYTFTAPSSGNLVILTDSTQGRRIEAAIYDTCGGNELFCFSQGNRKTVTGLTGGQTYVLQVWHDDYNKGVFTIALEELPPPPANDQCSGAEELTVGTSCNPITGDNTWATDSGEASPGCGGYNGGDLWYKAVVPATGALTFETSSVAGSDVHDTGMAVYSGDCGNLTLLECDDDGGQGLFSKITAVGQNPGDTLYVRVWEYGNNAYGEIGICAYEVNATVPPNDDCANALNLTVYPEGGGAGHETNGSTEFATASSMSQTSCDSYGTNLDLFYTFTAPANGGVKVITGGATGSSIEAAIYDTCGGNEIACMGRSSTKLFGGLTPGQTYVLQVWHDDNAAGAFTIVIEEAPQPPVNDNCDGAIAISVSHGAGNCHPTYSDNTAATDSGAGSPGCANYSGGDLWFKAVVPSTGNITVETVAGNSGNVTDTGMAVYAGDCNNLSLLDCDDDGGSSFFSKVELTGQTAGDTLYIRVWEYGNNSFGEIGVCAYDPSVSVEELQALGFNFYPNPTGGQLTLKAHENIQHVSITNLTGQVLLSRDMDTNHVSLDISRLPSGVYLMNVRISGKEGTYRVVKE